MFFFQIFSKANRNNPVEIKNNVDALREVEVSAVDLSKPLTKLGAIEFNVGDDRKPWASAARIIKCGNVVVLDSFHFPIVPRISLNLFRHAAECP